MEWIFEKSLKVSEHHRKTWLVSKVWHGEKVSGGPCIAWFYEEDHADEYIEFKNKQLLDLEDQKKCNI